MRPQTGSGYDAFLSYSHAADGQLAPSLQRGLRGFAKPWYRLNALRVFRDQTSLSATPALWAGIERALAASRFFILLASSDAAASPWVDKEVSYWRDHKLMNDFLIALTEGEIAWDASAGDFDWNQVTALPRSLQKAFVSEPFWVDLRFARAQSDVSLRQPDFRKAIADLAAPIHGSDKDTLLGEDITQHRRTMRLAGAGVAILIALVIAASVSAFLAVEQRNTARRQRDAASSFALASAANAQLDRNLPAALLLGLEANGAKSTAAARGAMISALEKARSAGLLLSLRGAPRFTRGVAISADGRMLAAEGEEGVRIWDLSARRLVTDIPVYKPFGGGVAFSPNGRILAFGVEDGVRLWDVQAHKLRKVRRTGDFVESAVFSPDGKTLAFGGYAGIRLWNWRARRPPLIFSRGDFFDVSLAFSRDGRTLACSGCDGVRLWDVKSRTALPLLREHRRGGTNAVGGPHVAVNSNGSIVAAPGRNRTLLLWHARTRRAPLVLHTGGSVNSVAFSPDDRTLAAGLDTGMQLWNVPQRKRLGVVRTNVPVHALAFSSDGRRLAFPYDNGTVQVLDVQPRRPLAELQGRRRAVRSVAFSPDGRTLAFGSENGSVWLWDVRRHKELRGPLYGPSEFISSVVFSPNGRVLAAGGDGIRLWAVTGHRAPVDLPGADGQTIAVSSDGEMLATGSGGSEGVQLWDLPSRKQLHEFFADAGVVTVAFDPNGQTLALGGGEETVELWQVRGRRRRLRGLNVGTETSSVAFSPDGSMLAVGGTDGTVQLWDVRARKRLAVVRGDKTAVLTVAFSPDGDTFASGGIDGAVRVWDVRAREPLVILRGHAGAVISVNFSPDGRTIVSGGLDGRVRLWGGILWRNFDDLQTLACDLVVGNLTRAEWSELAPNLSYRATCPD
jgi:WD40 repeat protein